jgi:hypothetical protein
MGCWTERGWRFGASVSGNRLISTKCLVIGQFRTSGVGRANPYSEPDSSKWADHVMSKERVQSEYFKKRGRDFWVQVAPCRVEIYLGLGFSRIFSASEARGRAQFWAHYLGIGARCCLRRLRRRGAHLFRQRLVLHQELHFISVDHFALE